jgi:predicted Zn finger-like uncharacterized protein
MSNSEDIVTRCPQCNTAFRVTLNQLAVADGQVRCGSCLAVFKAVDHDARKEASLKIKLPDQEEAKTSTVPKELLHTTANAVDEASSKVAINPTEKLPSKLPVSGKPAGDTGTVEATSKTPAAKQPQPEAIAAADLDDVLITDDNEQNRLDLDGDIFDLDSKNNNSKTSLFDRKLNEVKEHRRESADESWAVRMLAELEEEENEDKTHFITEPRPEPKSVKNNSTNHNEELNDGYEVKIEPSYMLDDFDDGDDKQNPDYSQIDLDIYNDDGSEADNSGALYFDQNSVSAEAETSDSHKPSSLESDIDNNADTEILKPQASISDDAIDNAMSSRTHYQDDSKNYLANIEPAPVEMMDFSSPSAQRWLWRAGAIIAGLLLLLQIAILRFDTLSKHPSYRPFFSYACNLVGCSLPPLLDTQQIRTTNLIVRSHPRQQNALIIDAILINNAQFSQAFPALQLEFNDINDQLVASRQLEPNEYLRGELAGAREMANNQPIQLSIEIVDPGDSAVNYQLTVVPARPKDNKN